MASEAEEIIDLVSHVGRNHVPPGRRIAHDRSVPDIPQLRTVVAA